jgi:hypothetical protein
MTTTVRKDINLLDELHDEIACARGIQAAMFGVHHVETPDMIHGVINLQEHHIDRLEQIELRLKKIMGVGQNRPEDGADNEG